LIVPSPFRFSRRPALTFGIAGFLAIVTAISFFLMEIYQSQDPNYAPLLLLAVVIGTLFGGKKLGLVTVVLSALASAYFVLHSAHALLAQLPHTVLLAVLATIIWWAIAAATNAAEFLENARDELQQKNKALQAEDAARRTSEKLLRASEEKFRALSENSPAAIIIFQGDTIRYANVAASAISGYSSAELLQKNFWDLAHSDIRNLVRERGQTMQRGEPPFLRSELRIVTKTGEERWLDVAEGMFELDGSPAVVGLAFDITERKLAEEAVKATTEQLRALTLKLQSAREEEGQRIGREIHDEIGSAMTSLKWDLESLDQACGEIGAPAHSRKMPERIRAMLALIDDTSNTVRRISSELRPVVLDDLGLTAAIEWQVEQFTAHTGIVCVLDAAVESVEIDRERAVAVFRIIQEALTNVMRHSRATRVDITSREEEHDLVFSIKDNGRGISKVDKGPSSSLGLIGMQERAYLVGGTVVVDGSPENGTTVTIRVPVAGRDPGTEERAG